MPTKAAIVVGLLAALLGAPLGARAQTTQCVSSAIAGGTADALTVPALPCSVTTTLLILRITLTNATASPTLQQQGQPAWPIVTADGTPMAAGLLVAGGTDLFSFNGTQWILLAHGSSSTTISTSGTITTTSSSSTALSVPSGGALIGGNLVVNGTLTVGGTLVGTLRNYKAGLLLANDAGTPTTLLDIAAGVAADSTSAQYLTLAAGITKSISGSWTVGSGNNGMGQGLTATAATWYHVFLIKNGSNIDAYFDTSATAANAPVGTTAFRRIGSILLDSSAHIMGFFAANNWTMWNLVQSPGSNCVASPSATCGYTSTNVPTTLTQITLGAVPPGFNFGVLVTGVCANASVPNGFYVVSDNSAGTGQTVNANGPTCFAQVSNQNASIGQSFLMTGVAADVSVKADAASTTGKVLVLGYQDFWGANH